MQLRRVGWRDADRSASVWGSQAWLRDTDPPVWWLAGQAGIAGELSDASDSFFAHLPGLLAEPPDSVVLLGPGMGGVLDAARRSTFGGIRTWTASSAHRRLLYLEGRGNVGADPSVRIYTGYGPAQASRAGPHSAVLVNMPPPWVAGGAHAWSPAAIRQIDRLVAEDGHAVFRIPLGEVSGQTLGSFIRSATDVFDGLSAWLDPTGSKHVLLVAHRQAGPIDAGAVFRAWSRQVVRKDLRAASLRSPADVLERLLFDHDGLLTTASSATPIPPQGSSVLSGVRARNGRSVLPLGHLNTTPLLPARAFDFETVPKADLAVLRERLEKRAATRSHYLALLEAIALGRGVEALAIAQQVAESTENSAKDLRALILPWITRGDQFRNQGLLEQAKAEYLIAGSFSPDDPDANLRLADIHRRLGELAEGEKRYRQVREVEPNSLQAILGLGSLLETQGRYAEAASLLEDAEKLHPGEAILLINLGALHLRLAAGADEASGRHVVRARVLLQTAASLEPRMAEPHGGLAEVFSLLGEHDRALTEIDRAIALNDHCTYRGWRGQILWELGKNTEAERSLQQALLECPNHLPALTALGGLLVDRGCYRQGRETWERVGLLDPGNRVALANLEQITLSGVEKSIGENRCR
ncbi:MAG: tetratricopeptide repeat protein, partial [Myxococcota bacterium]|nr:tetratricopeptide repeat protein [Myxococcota bacterium]